MHLLDIGATQCEGEGGVLDRALIKRTRECLAVDLFDIYMTDDVLVGLRTLTRLRLICPPDFGALLI